MTLGELWSHFLNLRYRVEELARRVPMAGANGANGDDGTNPDTGNGCSITGGSTTTIGTNGEGSEAADSATWTAGDGPLEIWEESRTAYFSAGDKKLYGYARKKTYDACGKLQSVSAEVRYEIDNPTLCP